MPSDAALIAQGAAVTVGSCRGSLGAHQKTIPRDGKGLPETPETVQVRESKYLKNRPVVRNGVVTEYMRQSSLRLTALSLIHCQSVRDRWPHRLSLWDRSHGSSSTDHKQTLSFTEAQTVDDCTAISRRQRCVRNTETIADPM